MPWPLSLKSNQAIVYFTANETSHCHIDRPRSWTSLLTNTAVIIPLLCAELRRWEDSLVSMLRLITQFTKSDDDYCSNCNNEGWYCNHRIVVSLCCKGPLRSSSPNIMNCNNEGCPSISQRQGRKAYIWPTDIPLWTGTASKHIWNLSKAQLNICGFTSFLT